MRGGGVGCHEAQELGKIHKMGDQVKKASWVLALALAGCSLFGGATVVAGKDLPLAMGLGFDYASGDYGTGVSSDSSSVSLAVDYFPTDRLSFELIIPYLWLSSSATLTSGGARFPVADAGTGHGHGGSGGPGMGSASLGNPGPPDWAGPGPGGSVTASTTAATEPEISQAQSGLGDVVLNTGYVLIKEGKKTPQLRPTLYVKFPTADEEKNLGTGELDLGVGLEMSKWIERWYLYGFGSYVSQGANEIFHLKDFLTY